MGPPNDGALVSSFCSSGACVRVIPDVDQVVVDDGAGSGRELRFTRAEWAAFVAGVKNGEFDLD